jgi:hypothetical protein
MEAGMAQHVARCGTEISPLEFYLAQFFGELLKRTLDTAREKARYFGPAAADRLRDSLIGFDANRGMTVIWRNEEAAKEFAILVDINYGDLLDVTDALWPHLPRGMCAPVHTLPDGTRIEVG